MIVKDLQPLSVVEQEGFKNLIKTLDPRYRMPSRKFFMGEKIPSLYEECCSKVKRCLDAAHSVVLTTDMTKHPLIYKAKTVARYNYGLPQSSTAAKKILVIVVCVVMGVDWGVRKY